MRVLLVPTSLRAHCRGGLHFRANNVPGRVFEHKVHLDLGWGVLVAIAIMEFFGVLLIRRIVAIDA